MSTAHQRQQGGPSNNRTSSVTSQKPRQLSHLHSQLAQLTAHISDLENLLKVTAVQAESIRGLGGYSGAMYVHVISLVCNCADVVTGSWQQAKSWVKRLFTTSGKQIRLGNQKRESRPIDCGRIWYDVQQRKTAKMNPR